MALSEQQQRKRSKQLSYILRHRPDSIGIELDDQGWVAVDTLLEALSKKHQSWNRPLLERIVAHCPKQRFAFSEDNTHIRANQGHSVRVEFDHPERTPPRWLWSASQNSEQQLPGPMNIILPHPPVLKMLHIVGAWGTDSLKLLNQEISNPEF